LRIIPVLIVACFFAFPVHAKYSGGSGTAQDPYQIATAADLIALGETPDDYDKHFILTADIDLDPNLPGRKVFDKAVIAPDTDKTKDWFQGTRFAGVFDGAGHVISHLTIQGKEYLGLFGWLSRADVKNLGVVEVNVTGSDGPVGGLVGLNEGSVTDSYSTGAVSGPSWDVGGLVGLNDGPVTRCYSTGAVRGKVWVGGLVGRGWEKNVSASFWDIQTSGLSASAGGGTGKTTAQMQMASIFLDAGWDFVGETKNGTEDIWWILEGKDYPRLWWEPHN
jgi:hypothetical protein